MKLTGITRALAEIDFIDRLRQAPRSARIFGLLGAARPAAIAALVEDGNYPCLTVTPHPQQAQALAEDLSVWTSRDVLLFPALEALPYERVRLDRCVLADRQAAARALADGAGPIIVAPARALLQPIQLPAADRALTITVGDEINLERLLRTLLSWGYAEVPVVDQPASFARRGGMVDIFAASAQAPVRIELFGHEVETLRTFDIQTQRSTGRVSQTTMPPVAAVSEDARLAALQCLMDADLSSLSAEARTRWMDDLARLEAGAGVDELPLFAPYILSPAGSLVGVTPPSAMVILNDADAVAAVLDDLWEQGKRIQQDLEKCGELPRGLRPALLNPADVTQAWSERIRLELHSGSNLGAEGLDWSDIFHPAPRYAGRLRTFSRDMQAPSTHRTVAASHQSERLQELLAEDGVAARVRSDLEGPVEAGLTLVPGGVSSGWIAPQADLTLLSDYELFGRKTFRPLPRKPAAREAFFADFAPGDYVVHIEHGIGRFDGMTRMALDGAEREYAVIQYLGADRVYVPSDQLERLTRYVGVGDSPPSLSRLGGGEWQRARARAKQATAEIAAELVDVYAKRMARPGYAFEGDTPWQSELESSFAYPETPDQERAVEEVKQDMQAPRPMDRLVCADVGYGKTEVAVRAAFKAVMDGKQVAILAPTTILAQQHYETFAERFEAFPVRIEVLSRFRTRQEQQDVLRRLTAGEVDVVIGTHRLLGKDVSFKSLGLLVIDEEQRFGVRHKEQLKKLRETIDVLTLTATPIPRTLHMGLVGIREISVIETPPEGRLPIKTYLQPFEERLVRDAVVRELDRDGQVYVVHNKVATIEAMAERIRRLVPEARVVVGHGQMDEAQLERVMLTFARHEADVLVSSTIIENGLDIPNVNTIVINNAHRLGLTQLYQLRGRVGRSANQAYAYLLYPADVRLTHDALRRMEAVFEAQELGAGFTVAMRDLEIRGAGNLLGAEQSGHASAIGFDLYTRMIADAVERMRGEAVEEPPLVSVDLPLSMLLPVDFVSSEPERLSLYRRLAAVTTEDELDRLGEEIRDRFGPLPQTVENLLTSVRIKLLARSARVQSIALTAEALIFRAEARALYDRVSLYRRYGMEARISTNVLRIPRRLLGADWVEEIRSILAGMIEIRQSVGQKQAAGA